MANNKEFGLQDRLDSIRRELSDDIKKKVSDKTFWAVVTIAVLAIGFLFTWTVKTGERITVIETTIKMTEPANSRPLKKN